MPSEGRGRKTGNPVLRLPGRHGKKGCLAGNITVKSWRTEDDVPAAVASENGRVWLYCLAPKCDGKNTFFSIALQSNWKNPMPVGSNRGNKT